MNNVKLGNNSLSKFAVPDVNLDHINLDRWLFQTKHLVLKILSSNNVSTLRCNSILFPKIKSSEYISILEMKSCLPNWNPDTFCFHIFHYKDEFKQLNKLNFVEPSTKSEPSFWLAWFKSLSVKACHLLVSLISRKSDASDVTLPSFN